VLGLARFPLDGNPYRYCGIIAHTERIGNLALSNDHQHIFSAGGADKSVNMWSAVPHYLNMQTSAAGQGMDPFLKMLDPSGLGRDSAIYKEFQDYFYYCQVQHQGENSSQTRQTHDKIPLEYIGPMCQAMGFYPSYQDIDDMINEIKYSEIEGGEELEVKTIALDDIIKCKCHY
jgi:hypothetical protein